MWDAGRRLIRYEAKSLSELTIVDISNILRKSYVHKVDKITLFKANIYYF